MDSNVEKALEITTIPSPSDGWKERIGISTALAGIVGGGAGLLSKHSKVYGISNISANYAANCAIVTASYCGAREFVRVSRHKDDLLNSVIGGFGAGALLGRLQGGQMGAIRYSIIFAVVGTTMDFATTKLRPRLNSFTTSTSGDNDSSHKSGNWLKLPEWSPIQILDEEALAEKHAREKQLAERTRIIVDKDES